jgi:hypothetical protein
LFNLQKLEDLKKMESQTLYFGSPAPVGGRYLRSYDKRRIEYDPVTEKPTADSDYVHYVRYEDFEVKNKPECLICRINVNICRKTEPFYLGMFEKQYRDEVKSSLKFYIAYYSPSFELIKKGYYQVKVPPNLMSYTQKCMSQLRSALDHECNELESIADEIEDFRYLFHKNKAQYNKGQI